MHYEKYINLLLLESVDTTSKEHDTVTMQLISVERRVLSFSLLNAAHKKVSPFHYWFSLSSSIGGFIKTWLDERWLL